MDTSTIRTYYHLTKPGIVRGNALAAFAGYCFAAGYFDKFSVSALLGMLVGICLVMASGCVFNNYIDRDIDRKMERTKKRALVTGAISAKSALIYGSLLLIIGIGTLLALTNLLTSMIALFGFFAYVVLYGIAKRATVHGTLVGAISGAVPPVVGYTAVSNQFDVAALLLFVTMFAWQLPHFYAIAMYRARDYKNARIPVLAVVKKPQTTRRTILASIIVFIVSSSLLTLTGYAGYIYLVAMLSLGLYWLITTWRAMPQPDEIWAKYVFKKSLLVLLSWNVLLCFANILR